MDPKQTARDFVRDWQNLFGERLRAALLFGSVARGEYVDGTSDINVLLLIDHIDTATLKRATGRTRTWLKAAREAPLVFELDQWRRASDVFAIEISDMRDAHELLHGEDPVADAQIRPEELRHQAERELRGKLLALQTGLLVAAETPADVGRLLLNSVPSFATYMRAVLRLTDQPVPLDTAKAIGQACEQASVNPAAILRVWEARSTRAPLKIAVDDPLVDAYYETVEKTADFVDTYRR